MATDATQIQLFRSSLGDLAGVNDVLQEARVQAQTRPATSRLEKAPVLYAVDARSSAVANWFKADMERLAILDAAITAVEKLRAESYPALTDFERRGLEAVILLEGRPALLIGNGTFQSPPESWKHLSSCREQIEYSASRVGRIESSQNGVSTWHGTGFLVGPEAVITNRHVAALFARNEGQDWHFKPGSEVSIDFLREYGRDATALAKCVAVVGVHEQYDLAVLRIEVRGEETRDPFSPLRFWGAPPSGLLSREGYAIGYPGQPALGSPEITAIFSGLYGVKRLLPGKILSLTSSIDSPAYLTHDCSTLGGSSGSCVIDLVTHLVLGVHYGGRHLVENRAVPLWLLRDDPLIKKAAMEFLPA